MGDLVGRVVRLQIQQQPLKAPHGWYDPTRLTAVERLVVGPDGVFGLHEDGWVVDVHHRLHPRSRGGGRRSVSVGFTGHYAAMARRFGRRATLGIAGENLVVDAPALRLGDLGTGLAVVGEDGARIELHRPRAAAPCREFTSFLLGRRRPLPREALGDELAFLSAGTRGFIVVPVGGPVEVGLGAEVWRLS